MNGLLSRLLLNPGSTRLFLQTSLRPSILSCDDRHSHQVDQIRNMATKLQRPGQRVLIKEEETQDKRVKFTTSDAYKNYLASDNFHGRDERDLPPSHNLVLASTVIIGIYYLIFLRDDVEADGAAYLFKPVHETLPELAIPLIQSALVENRRLGYDTTKLEKKLRELNEKPEKHGAGRRKLVEN